MADEIEIRGACSKNQFHTLQKFLEEKGRFEKTFKRLTVDISPGFDPRTRRWDLSRSGALDLRLKKTDEEEKISLKFGNFHEVTRKELEVIVQTGQFLATVELFKSLGFNQGMIYFWESWVYEYEGVEVKITKYTDDYCLWEIEARGEVGEMGISKVAQELHLQPLDIQGYKDQIDYANDHIHQLFSPEAVEELLKAHF